jgi:hypothetical protein
MFYRVYVKLWRNRNKITLFVREGIDIKLFNHPTLLPIEKIKRMPPSTPIRRIVSDFFRFPNNSTNIPLYSVYVVLDDLFSSLRLSVSLPDPADCLNFHGTLKKTKHDLRNITVDDRLNTVIVINQDSWIHGSGTFPSVSMRSARELTWQYSVASRSPDEC